MYEKNNTGLCLAALDLIKKGGTYAEKDCQGFVEAALQMCGVDRKDYTGSNAMLRQMVHGVKALDGNMQSGDIVFWVRFDNKEHEKYKAGGHRYVAEFEGWNATHVGIYLGNGYIAESASSIGHWAITELKKRKPTHYAKHTSLVYMDDSEALIPPAIEAVKREDSADNEKETLQAKVNIAYVKYKETNYQNLRAAADPKSPILAAMPTGSEVELLGKADAYGWVKVRYMGLEGYMSGRAYVRDLPAGVQTAEPVLDSELAQIKQENEELRKEIEDLKFRLMEIENHLEMGVG